MSWQWRVQRCWLEGANWGEIKEMGFGERPCLLPQKIFEFLKQKWRILCTFNKHLIDFKVCRLITETVSMTTLDRRWWHIVYVFVSIFRALEVIEPGSIAIACTNSPLCRNHAVDNCAMMLATVCENEHTLLLLVRRLKPTEKSPLRQDKCILTIYFDENWWKNQSCLTNLQGVMAPTAPPLDRPLCNKSV